MWRCLRVAVVRVFALMVKFANKSKLNSFYPLLQLPGILIDDIYINDNRIEIEAQIKGKSAMCPKCRKKRTRVHSRYFRKLKDLAVFTKEVSIRLQVAKFICNNSRCQRKIFSQQLSVGFDRYSRRTTRVDYASYLDDLIKGYSAGENLSIVYRRIEDKGFRGTQRGLGAKFGGLFKEGKQNYRMAAIQDLSSQYPGQSISPRKLTIFLTNKHYDKLLTPSEEKLFFQIPDKGSPKVTKNLFYLLLSGFSKSLVLSFQYQQQK